MIKFREIYASTGTRDQIANICWITESRRLPEKHLLLLYWLYQCLWLCGSQETGKYFKKWEYQTTWPTSWETYMQVRKQQLELDMEQQTVPNRKRSPSRLYIVTLLYLTSMQSTSCKTLGWRRPKLESRLPGEISITSDMQMTPPLWQKVKRN